MDTNLTPFPAGRGRSIDNGQQRGPIRPAGPLTRSQREGPASPPAAVVSLAVFADAEEEGGSSAGPSYSHSAPYAGPPSSSGFDGDDLEGCEPTSDEDEIMARFKALYGDDVEERQERIIAGLAQGGAEDDSGSEEGEDGEDAPGSSQPQPPPQQLPQVVGRAEPPAPSMRQRGMLEAFGILPREERLKGKLQKQEEARKLKEQQKEQQRLERREAAQRQAADKAQQRRAGRTSQGGEAEGAGELGQQQPQQQGSGRGAQAEEESSSSSEAEESIVKEMDPYAEEAANSEEAGVAAELSWGDGSSGLRWLWPWCLFRL